MKEDIILLGIGGHSHSVVDSIEQAGEYNIVGFLDVVEKQEMQYKGYKVLGTDKLLKSYYQKGVKNAFVTIGYMGKGNLREELYYLLKKIGYKIPSIIDTTAILSNDMHIGEGTFIGKRVVVNANTVIGKMCIINTGAIIEHDCVVEDFSHVAVNSVLCGGVYIGKETFVGANATVIQGKHIGNKCIIGAGETIKYNVEPNKVIKR